MATVDRDLAARQLAEATRVLETAPAGSAEYLGAERQAALARAKLG
jgi:hypothetical protein